MILTTFICERKKSKNQNNINISNEGLLNLTPSNVRVHKGCAYGFTIPIFALNHLLVFAPYKCHEKFKIRVFKSFSKWHGGIRIS